MEIFHPETFQGRNIGYNTALIHQARARCGLLIGRDSAKDRLEETTNVIMKITQPSYWNAFIKGNADVETERQAEMLLINVGEHTKKDVENISMLRFYYIMEFITSKQQANNTNG